MHVRLVAGFTALALGLLAIPAAGAGKPLRHLAFSYVVGVDTTFEAKTSGLRMTSPGIHDPGGSMIGVSGSATQRSNATTTDRGTIVADVVGLTEDGGLLVDVSEEGRERKWMPAAVAVRSDGLLSIYRGTDLSDEARYVLSLLARRLIDGEPTVGETWTLQHPAPKHSSDVTTFHVTGVQATIAHLAVERTAYNRSLQGFNLHLTGAVDYDWKRLVPISASLNSMVTSQSAEGLTTIKTDCTLSLLDDSFAK